MKIPVRVVIGIVLLAFFGSGLVLLLKTNTSKQNPTILPKFDRTQINHFKWTALDEEIEFKKDANGQWIPFPEEGSISALLTHFASLKTEASENPPPENSKVEIELGNQSFSLNLWWNGVTIVQSVDGRSFFNSEVSEALAKLLNQGRFTFYDRSFYWCPSRPLNLQIKNQDSVINIEFKESTWMDGDRKIEKPETIENWFSSNCQLEIERFIDPKIKTVPLSNPTSLIIKFKGGEIIQLHKHNQNIFRISNYEFYFVSEALSKSLEKLKTVSK